MRELAAEVAKRVRLGDVIAIEGPLGSGKTAFVRGLAAALVGGDPATSPTFTFWHRYGGHGNVKIEHLDLYRIENDGDLAELGLEEAFSPGAITVVEWPERAPSLVGIATWRIQISGSGDAPREVTIHAGA